MDRAVIIVRLDQVRQAKQQHVRRHSELTQAAAETVNQINALAGREAELTELLALVDTPQEPPIG